jgi:photosystem II stability/assembly factor-like uncharacterized protein
MRIKLTLLVFLLTSLACSVNVSSLKPAPTLTPSIFPTEITATAPSSTVQPVVKPEAISSIHMLDVQNGWMITAQNILRTADGGTTWQDVTPLGASGLGSGIGSTFLDSNRGWILTSDASDPINMGTLYRTMDGGATWTSNPVPFGGGNLHFLDNTNGWMMLSGEVIRGDEPANFRPFFQGVRFFQSTDGGVNWTQTYTNMSTDAGAGDSLPYDGLKTGFTPINMQEAWVSGLTLVVNDFYLYHTADGGHTWSLTDFKLPFNEERYHLDPPEFFDAQSGVLPFEAGSEGASLLFSLTEDGGQTWTVGDPISGTSHYSVVSPHDIFAWPDVFSVSHDGGQTWTQLTPNVDLSTSLIQLQFIDTQTGWAVTSDNTGHTSLYKSTDGGMNWDIQN